MVRAHGRFHAAKLAERTDVEAYRDPNKVWSQVATYNPTLPLLPRPQTPTHKSPNHFY